MSTGGGFTVPMDGPEYVSGTAPAQPTKMEDLRSKLNTLTEEIAQNLITTRQTSDSLFGVEVAPDSPAEDRNAPEGSLDVMRWQLEHMIAMTRQANMVMERIRTELSS